jgi:hypothetical protein
MRNMAVSMGLQIGLFIFQDIGMWLVAYPLVESIEQKAGWEPLLCMSTLAWTPALVVRSTTDVDDANDPEMWALVVSTSARLALIDFTTRIRKDYSGILLSTLTLTVIGILDDLSRSFATARLSLSLPIRCE